MFYMAKIVKEGLLCKVMLQIQFNEFYSMRVEGWKSVRVG